MTDQDKKPYITKVNRFGIPETLKAWAQWVCWKLIWDGIRWAKVPLDPKTGRFASSTDPSTWGNFAQAWSYYQSHRSNGIMGVGFVLTKADPFVAVDLDHCRDAETGALLPWALEVVQCLNSYTEHSPSGTGLHIFVRGVLPPGLRKKGDVEMYEDAHYFTVTGSLVNGVSQAIEGRKQELGVMHALFLGDHQGALSDSQAPSTERQMSVTRGWETLPKGLPHAELTPADLEIVRQLRKGRYGELYRLLFSGDLKGAGPLRSGGYYRSASEADLAMLNLLAQLTNGDPGRMYAVFKESGLMRVKAQDHPSYMARTIQKAIEGLGYRPVQASPGRQPQQ